MKQTDLATFPMIEDSLRADLGDALQNAVDVDLLTRAATGLLTSGNGTDPTAPTAATDGETFIADAYSGVDGIYASNVNQVRMLMGPETYRYCGALAYQTNRPDLTLEKLQGLLGGVFVSDNAGAYTSNSQEGLVIKGPARRNCVGALWAGIQIIRDEVTRARQGEVRIHVLGMWDFSVVRPAGYVRKRYRTS